MELYLAMPQGLLTNTYWRYNLVISGYNGVIIYSRGTVGKRAISIDYVVLLHFISAKYIMLQTFIAIFH